jgi:hypothetical protein
MGKLMIRNCARTDCVRGGKPAWKNFHDEFLQFGGPPILLVRKAMLPGDRVFVLAVCRIRAAAIRKVQTIHEGTRNNSK